MSTLKILGPPGCGKTESLLQYLEAELHSTPPNRIAFLTFTRSARQVALSRVGRSAEDLPFLRTIHAICYRQLGVSQDRMIRKRDLSRFGEIMGEPATGAGVDPWAQEDLDAVWEPPTRLDELLRLNHLGRHRKLQLRAALEGTEHDWHYAKWFTESYRSWKEQEGLLDYTDLLTQYLKHGQPLDIDVLFIDEAQDLSTLQWEVVHKLGARARTWYITGDDDQCCFEWAGATAENFIQEPSDENRVLSQSYRVPGSVHLLAKEVVERIQRRLTKSYLARPVAGVVDLVTQPQNLEAGVKTLVLYRNHSRAGELSKTLTLLGLPFSGPGTVLSNEEVHLALKGWWRGTHGLSLEPLEVKALLHVANPAKLRVDRFKVGLQKLEDLLKLDESSPFEHLSRLPRLAYLERVMDAHGFESLLEPKIELMSIHQAKGREADLVVLDPVMAQRTWEGYQQNPDGEARVFYVGVTRARERLQILVADDPRSYPLIS